MKPFLNEDFLLQNSTAAELYHDYAKKMPIYDYHCHLSPQEIAEDKTYKNITELWLGGDHYKWRAMRSNGIDEKYITGDAPDKDKFFKWSETLPGCIGNPLYHWTHLELKRYFGINEQLSLDTAEDIWNKCNEMLSGKEFTARSLIRRSNVRVLCTTDDPADTLEHHQTLANDRGYDIKVLPAFRPDKALNITAPGFIDWIHKLEQAAGCEIKDIESLKSALLSRINFFNKVGCKVSDHAMDPMIYRKSSEHEASEVLKKALAGKIPDTCEVEKYKTEIMLFLGRQYAKLGWTMQLHLGTMRNCNTRMMRLLGPDTGFDAIGDWNHAQALAHFLDALDKTDELPKTILYSLNARDNDVLATLMGCFQGSCVPGKIQLGSAWWFNDQKDGMEKQLISLANLGLLRKFVGMLTDSRSFLSYTRHEYFRRILCNLIGNWVENGEAPKDMELLGKMVQDVCFNNANRYFGI